MREGRNGNRGVPDAGARSVDLSRDPVDLGIACYTAPMANEGSGKGRMRLPQAYQRVMDRHPEVARQYLALGDAAHQAGPLSERERRLVKLALSIGGRLEGGVHSQARKCLQHGVSPEDLRHVALLATTTIGWPSMVATMTWIDDVIASAEGDEGSGEPGAE